MRQLCVTMRTVLLHLVLLTALLPRAARCKDDEAGLEPEDVRKKDAGFFFTYPRTLLSGKNETVCLVLQDVAVPTKALIDVKIKEKHHAITKIMHSDHSCFELPVPKHDTTEVLSAGLHLQLVLNGSIHSAHSQEAVLIYPDTDVTFLETDRGVYKQGDKVRIRVLVLGQDMKPSSKKKPVKYLKVINPHGFTVAVWDDIELQTGLAQLEYDLAEETVLGKWRIECNGILKLFFVKRYVVPRFKIEITAPKTIYIEQSVLDIKVCAKYTFDKFVNGIVLIKISYQHINDNSISRIMRIENTCAHFLLSNGDLKLSSKATNEEPVHTMTIVASVTEDGTNEILTETTTVSVKAHPYDLKFSEDNSYFQAGIPYRGKLRLVDANVEVENVQVQICYQVAVKKTWNIKPEECSEFGVDEEGNVVFYLLPFKENVIEVKLSAKPVNCTNSCPEATFVLRKWHSLTGNYLHIERNVKSLSKCRSPQQYTVYYTTNKMRSNENLTFYYLVKTRNTILQMRKIQHTPSRYQINFKNELKNVVGKENHKFQKLENYVDRFILKFKLHNSILSKSQLFVFYLNKDEVISNSIDVYVEKCLMNQVDTLWVDETMYPGELATFHINAAPNSLCAVSSIDKASTFLASHKTLNIHSILQPFVTPREAKITGRLNCLAGQKRKLAELRRRRKRAYATMTSSRDFDSFEMFNSHGLSAISNARMISKPCPVEDKGAAYPLHATELLVTPRSYEVLSDDKGVSIRSYFPETWLWELVPTGPLGRTHISKELPHTITSWVTSALCISPTEGIGIAQKQEINVFQPFFVDVITPAVVKRNEVMHLQIAAFNYLNYSIPIRIILWDTPGLEMVDQLDSKRMSFCLQSDKKFVHTFRVKGTVLGHVNVTVVAELESSYPNECGPETIVNKRDVVQKRILVESEGYSSEFTRSAMLCGEELNKIKWPIDIPNDRIGQSERIKLTFNSDLMGPTIQNLEKFIDMPMGCGEQVMATLAPNLYTLRYLKATGRLTANIRQRAIKNIKIGYQRILDYVHKDGSFSAFGYHDHAGSMFLTAFVVRTLQQAKEHTYVDQKVIRKATEWILQHQLENGCFAAVSHVFQDMGGTSMENSTAALTAYVIVSLMESKIELPESVKTNAKYCIRGQHNPDKYTLAISTYALYLLEWYTEADRYLERLLEISTKEGKLMWWSNPSGPMSVNIEMTAYALISLLEHYSSVNIIHAGAVVRWLGTVRGPQGGFTTTQDTVVALDAIARYSLAVKGKEADIRLHIKADDKKYDLDVNEGDKLKSKELKLYSIPKKIEISTDGKGCVLALLSISYNLKHVANSETFMLAVDVRPVSTIDKCSVAVVSPCISYKATGHSNMAVLEVSMPSGYEPDRASLYKLTQEKNTKLKRFDEYKNRVALYFTELNKEPICVPFKINENVIVEDQVEAVVRLYDYYNPERNASTTYKLNKCQPNIIALIPALVEVGNASKENSLEKSYEIEDYEEIEEENGEVIVKRDVKYGFNTDFVDLDFEMDTPQGMEGNMPMYVKKPNTTVIPK